VNRADVDATPHQRRTRFGDVSHHQVEVADAALRRGVSHAAADDDRARRARRRQLDDTHTVPRLHIVVEHEPDPLDVERLARIDVLDGQRDGFQSHLHHLGHV